MTQYAGKQKQQQTNTHTHTHTHTHIYIYIYISNIFSFITKNTKHEAITNGLPDRFV